MNRRNIAIRNKKKFKVNTESKHRFIVFENVLNREFNTDKPSTVWVSNITYILVISYWI